MLRSLPELEKFSSQDQNKLSTNSLDDMAMYLSLLSALSVGADHTMVTFTKVLPLLLPILLLLKLICYC